MRLIFDCNVVISASLSPNGTASQSLRKGEELHTLLASAETIEEFSGKIFKPKFDRYFKPVDVRVEIIARYTNLVEWVVQSHTVVICRDPRDNRYLGLALSGKADCIITGDLDLLALHPFENIPIVTPKVFLEKY